MLISLNMMMLLDGMFLDFGFNIKFDLDNKLVKVVFL